MNTKQHEMQTQKSETYATPAVDVFHNATGVILEFEVPGAAEGNVELIVEGTTLKVAAFPTATPQPELPLRHREFGFEPFRRSVTLSDRLDTERIEASLKDGVLAVTIPNRVEPGARKIAVRTSV
jgi:HSP20 family molecular chaperone IbpA